MPFEDGLLPVAPDYPTAVASSGPIALEDPEIPFVASVDRDDLDQQIDLSRYLFQPVELGPLERQDIERDLLKLHENWWGDTSDLRVSLASWLEQSEGAATPKDFPWPGSSNLFIPLTEIHLNNIHSQARQTLFRGSDFWYIRSIGTDPERQKEAPRLERWLNYISTVKMAINRKFSDLSWLASRDGMAWAQCTWQRVEGVKKEVTRYANVVQFLQRYPLPRNAGISKSKHDEIIARLTSGKPVVLVERVRQEKFRGVSITPVALKDAVFAPTNAACQADLRLMGKVFVLSQEQLEHRKKEGFYYKDAVDAIMRTQETGREDEPEQVALQLQGIWQGTTDDQFVFTDGLYRRDLDGDGIPEDYLIAFHPKSGKLAMMIETPFPRDIFIPVKMKSRPGKLIGRGLCAMLQDINTEVNTQHNQRIDGRTITTVPTFKAKKSMVKEFDPQRADQRFVPGRVFYLTNPADVEQFQIHNSDNGESMLEESNLFSIADQLTGASQLRSGNETKADPRAPAMKVMQLLAQSNIRLDDYFAEMLGDAKENEGFSAIGAFIIEAYHLFGDEQHEFPELDSQGNVVMVNPSASVGEVQNVENSQNTPGQNQPHVLSLSRRSLKTDDLRINLAKTSATQSPEVAFAKWMQLFQLLINEPLVGGRLEARAELIRELLIHARAENFERFLPPDVKQLAEKVNREGLDSVMQMMLQGQASQGFAGGLFGGPGGSNGGRTNDGAQGPSSPGIPGSTRPES